MSDEAYNELARSTPRVARSPFSPRTESSTPAAETSKADHAADCNANYGGECSCGAARAAELATLRKELAQAKERYDEVHAIAVEKDRLWSEACNERNAALAAVKQKDEALRAIVSDDVSAREWCRNQKDAGKLDYHLYDWMVVQAEKALAIQPDDSALRQHVERETAKLREEWEREPQQEAKE